MTQKDYLEQLKKESVYWGRVWANGAFQEEDFDEDEEGNTSLDYEKELIQLNVSLIRVICDAIREEPSKESAVKRVREEGAVILLGTTDFNCSPFRHMLLDRLKEIEKLDWEEKENED